MIDLVFEAHSLPTSEGVVICTLYQTAESWLSKDDFVASVSAPPVGDKAVCTFPNLPPGTYAVSFIQDVNTDGKMETSFFGFPKEPWGVSNDAPMRFGPPSFDDASFAHPSATVPFGNTR